MDSVGLVNIVTDVHSGVIGYKLFARVILVNASGPVLTQISTV